MNIFNYCFFPKVSKENTDIELICMNIPNNIESEIKSRPNIENQEINLNVNTNSELINSFQEIDLKSNNLTKEEIFDKLESPKVATDLFPPNELDNSFILEQIEAQEIDCDSLDSFIENDFQTFSDTPDYKFELLSHPENPKFRDYDDLYNFILPNIQFNGSFYNYTLNKFHHKVTIFMSDIKSVIDVVFKYYTRPLDDSVKPINIESI